MILNKLWLPTVLAIAMLSPNVFASDQGWFDPEFTPATKMAEVSVHTQSRVWATCAVAHDIAAMIENSEAPGSASAQESQQLSNGARLASAITFVVDAMGQDEDLTPRKFAGTWNMAKLAMESNYETLSTSINAKLERDVSATLAGFYPTYGRCLALRELQQEYVNIWRELYGSGLLSN